MSGIVNGEVVVDQKDIDACMEALREMSGGPKPLVGVAICLFQKSFRDGSMWGWFMMMAMAKSIRNESGCDKADAIVAAQAAIDCLCGVRATKNDDYDYGDW